MASARTKAQTRKVSSRPRKSAEVVSLYPRGYEPNREVVVYPPPVYHPPVYPPPAVPAASLPTPEGRLSIKLAVAIITGSSAIVAAIVSGLFNLESSRRTQSPPPANAAVETLKDPCRGAEIHWVGVWSNPIPEAYADHIAKFKECSFARLATLALAKPAKPAPAEIPSHSPINKPLRNVQAATATLPLTLTGYGE